MNYTNTNTNIIDPLNGKYHNISSVNGLYLLKKYVSFYKKHKSLLNTQIGGGSSNKISDGDDGAPNISDGDDGGEGERTHIDIYKVDEGKKYNIGFNNNNYTLLDLKTKIQEMFKIPIHAQRIINNNKILSPNSINLSDIELYQPIHLAHDGSVDVFEENVKNPIDITDWCTLSKRVSEKYYTHTYNPDAIIDRLNHFYDEYQSNIGTEYPKTFLENINTTERKGCCNCISLVLYITNPKNAKNAENASIYLLSIERTIINVQNNLPDWIVRIYLDPSVYEFYNNILANENKEKLDDSMIKAITTIFLSENVEIYTYACTRLLNKSIPISRTRMFRFLPLIDPNVNICIFRDADGIVTIQDCKNLLYFSKQPGALFDCVDIFDNHDYPNYKNIYNPFWLTKYRKHMDYKQKMRVELLAGVFGLKVKIKEEYFADTIEKINTNIKEAIDTLKGDEIASNKAIELFGIGYDEIFLYELFKDIIELQLQKKETERDLIYGLFNRGHAIQNDQMVTNMFMFMHKPYIESLEEFFGKIHESCFEKGTDLYKLYNDNLNGMNIAPAMYSDMKMNPYVILISLRDTFRHTFNLMYFIDYLLRYIDGDGDKYYELSLKYNPNKAAETIYSLLNVPYEHNDPYETFKCDAK